MKNIWRKAAGKPLLSRNLYFGGTTRASSLLMGLMLIVLSACAITHTPPIYRIALLAPFEGRYREIGYNALYAARVAFSGVETVELMPIDDGGSVATAVLRARALTHDPQVMAALLVGYHAADPQTQTALSDIPAIIVGRWTDARAADHVFILSSRDIHTPLDPVTIAIETPYAGGDVWMLEGARRLHDDLAGITVVTSGSAPREDFIEIYQAGNDFAPEPNLLATLTTDAAGLLIHAARTNDRAAAFRLIARESHAGMNGAITFGEDGYWIEAPVNRFRFENGAWVEADS